MSTSRHKHNVDLSLSNDPSLYCMVKRAVRYTRTLDAAAEALHGDLSVLNITHTPNGAPFTKTSIRYALRGMSGLRWRKMR